MKKEDLKQIGDLLDKKLDKKFAERDKKWDRKFAERDKRLDEKFAERDKKWDKKFAERDKRLDEKFAERDKRLDEKFDNFAIIVHQGFQEQKDYMDKRFDKIDIAFADLKQEIIGVEDEIDVLRNQVSNLIKKVDKMDMALDNLVGVENEDILAMNKTIERMQRELTKLKIKVSRLEKTK